MAGFAGRGRGRRVVLRFLVWHCVGLQFFVSGIFLSAANARTIAALQAARMPEIAIVDGGSQERSLSSVLRQAGDQIGDQVGDRSGGPVILLPLFTRCSASCPVLTHKLLSGLAGARGVEPYRVVLFAFDPLETDESLRLYRAREHVPPEWRIVRAGEGGIREFSEFFRYKVMNQDGTLIHPNEIFLLDAGLNWRWTLVGEDWTNEELAAAIIQTRSPGLVARIAARPERLAWTGFAAALLGICLPIGWMIRRRPGREVLA